MIVAVPKETFPGERRVALVPAVLPQLAKAGFDVLVEAGAGLAAGFRDKDYEDKGAAIISDRAELFSKADVVLQVRTPGANPAAGAEDAKLMRTGQIVIGHADPLGDPTLSKAVADAGATLFALELIPAHHPRPEHGRALVHGDAGGLSGRAARLGEPAQDVPHDDDGGRHHRPRPRSS